MEVTILESSCSWPKPVLALRAGSIRRQAKLEAQIPFVMPHPGTDAGQVEVSVLQQLATQMLPTDDVESEVYCAIPVLGKGGKHTQVTLRVQKSKALQQRSARKSADPEATREYLQTHNLQQRVQNLIQGLLESKPEDPYRFMVDELRRSRQPRRSKEGTDADEAAPKVPRPPDGPSPKVRFRRFGTGLQEERRVFAPKARWSALKEGLPVSRAVVRSVLESEKCLQVGVEAIRKQTQMNESRRLTEGILGSASRKVEAEAAEHSSLEVSRALLADVFTRTSIRFSTEYRRAMVHWTIRCALHGALNIFDANQEKYRGCATSWRRWSLPTPVVNLTPSSDWGRWLQ